MQALVNARLYDFERYLENGYLQFDERLVSVGDMADYPGGDAHVVDCHGRWVLPGFVCGHTHLYSAFSRGIDLPFAPTTFQEILDQLWWKLDRQLDNEGSYYSGLAFGSEFLSNGVTTVIDHHASGRDIRGSLTALRRAVVQKLGMRAVLAFETSDRFNLDECIDENVRFATENASDRVAGLFGMHASMSISQKSLMTIASQKGKIPIHIHVAESREDQADALAKYQMTILERLHQARLIDKDSLLVHCVHVDRNDLQIIKDSGGVICLNITSNMNNGVGLPDYRQMKAMGIPVILGNDGISASMTLEYLNFVYALHHQGEAPTACSLADLKNVIQETYRVASRRLHIPLGEFRPGAAADFQIVPYQPSTDVTPANALAHLFYGLFPNHHPDKVYVGGKIVYSEGQAIGYDSTDQKNAVVQSQKLWQRIRQEGR
jgi:cytosine/adenosine deaminase-related metal-dependent hydrolase